MIVDLLLQCSIVPEENVTNRIEIPNDGWESKGFNQVSFVPGNCI